MEQQNFPPAFRFPTERRDVIFGALTLACSIFLWNAILYGGFNLGFALGSMALIGCSVWYLRGCGHRFDRYSGSLILFALLIAAGFGRASAYLKLGMLLMLAFSVNLSLCLATGRNRRGSGGLSSVLDAPRAFFRFGFGGMGPALRGLNDARKNAGTAGKTGSAALMGLLAAIPVVAVLTVLMMRSDAAFEGLMELLPETDWSEPFWSAAYGVVCGWILYARALGLRHQPEPVRKERTFRGISTITVNILLIAVSGLYCIYFLSQLAYMGGGFSGVLPEGYTLAQYARRGFFEMAWLSAINLGLMCFSIGMAEKGSRGLGLTRGLCLFLGLAALFLICAASAKMILYIRSYGLTRLRVLTEIFMIWLGITTVLVCVWLFRPGFSYMRPVVVAALLLSTLTFWLDMDGRVAQYNVRAYQSGKLETVDMAHLSTLGYGAVPYIAELREDPNLSEAAEAILRRKSADIQDFRDWNYPEAAARSCLSDPAEP